MRMERGSNRRGKRPTVPERERSQKIRASLVERVARSLIVSNNNNDE